MKNGYSLGVLVFFLGVAMLMITDEKIWHYVTFLLAVVLVVIQMVSDKRTRARVIARLRFKSVRDR